MAGIVDLIFHRIFRQCEIILSTPKEQVGILCPSDSYSRLTFISGHLSSFNRSVVSLVARPSSTFSRPSINGSTNTSNASSTASLAKYLLYDGVACNGHVRNNAHLYNILHLSESKHIYRRVKETKPRSRFTSICARPSTAILSVSLSFVAFVGRLLTFTL